jgi:gliding motility-associatede transport system auxiliary component
MSPATLARRQALLSGLLLTGIVFLVVVLAQSVRLRGDLTEEKIYTLSPVLLDQLDQLEDRLQIKLYFNREIEGAEAMLPARLSIQDRLEEIAAAGGEFVSVETVDPTTDLVAARDAEHIGVTPITVTDARVGGVSLEKLYQGLEMRYQERSELIPFVVAKEFEFAFSSRLASLLRGGQRPVIGFFSREPVLPPPVPGVDQVAPEERVFENMRDVLAERYAVRDFRSFSRETPVPTDIVALVVARPEAVTAEELAQIDLYLQSGGHVLMLVDHEEVLPREGFNKRPFETGLDAWLLANGVRVAEEFLYDERCRPMPAGVQQVRQPDGSLANNTFYMPYGLYPVFRDDSFSAGHVVSARLEEVEMLWAHPVVFQAVEGSDLKAESLMRSSAQSYLLDPEVALATSQSNIQLLQAKAAQAGAPRPYDLVVAVSGHFGQQPAQATITNPPPALRGTSEPPAAQQPQAEGLLVVIGDSEVFHNLTLRGGSSNAKFAQNLVDWLAQDESLISLRSKGRRSRLLKDFFLQSVLDQGGPAETDLQNRKIDKQARAYRDSMERRIAWANVLVPPLLLLVAALAHFAVHRKRARRHYSSEEQRS